MRNYITPIINARLPGFLSSDYPGFKKFITHYFEFLEEIGNPLEILENFSERLEVNNEVDLYIDKVVSELGFDINRQYLIPKKELVLHLRDFYLSRGSVNSFKFLFTALYGDSIEIEYPRDRLFSLSNAIYTGNLYVFTSATNEDSPEFQKLIDAIKELNITIRGVSSKVTASVEDIQILVSKNKHFLKIQIDSALKNFLPYEGVVIEVANDPSIKMNEYIMNSIDIAIDHGGKGYRVGDEIVSTGCGINGRAIVKTLAGGSIQSLNIIHPGSGYSVGDRVIAQNTVRGHSFSAIVNIVGTVSDPPVGAIRHIKILSPGYEFDAIPDLTIVDSSGVGAVIEAGSEQIGKILTVEIIEPFVDALNLSSVVYSIDTEEGSGAILSPDAKVVYTEKSSFKTLKGALEVNCIILDSYFFQQFSYILRSAITRSDYDAIVDEMVHPSGFVRFAMLDLYFSLDLNIVEEWKYGAEWLSDAFSILKRIKIMNNDLSFLINPVYTLEDWKENKYSFLNSVGEFDWFQEEYIHDALRYMSPALEAVPIIKIRAINNPTQIMVNPINNLEWFKESVDERLDTNYPVSNSIWGDKNLPYIHDNSNLMNRALDVELHRYIILGQTNAIVGQYSSASLITSAIFIPSVLTGEYSETSLEMS